MVWDQRRRWWRRDELQGCWEWAVVWISVRALMWVRSLAVKLSIWLAVVGN